MKFNLLFFFRPKATHSIHIYTPISFHFLLLHLFIHIYWPKSHPPPTGWSGQPWPLRMWPLNGLPAPLNAFDGFSLKMGLPNKKWIFWPLMKEGIRKFLHKFKLNFRFFGEMFRLIISLIFNLFSNKQLTEKINWI
jgi:hypothetical protein